VPINHSRVNNYFNRLKVNNFFTTNSLQRQKPRILNGYSR